MALAGYIDPKQAQAAQLQFQGDPRHRGASVSAAEINAPEHRLARVLQSFIPSPHRGDVLYTGPIVAPQASPDPRRSHNRETGYGRPVPIPEYLPDLQQRVSQTYASLIQRYYEPQGSAVLEQARQEFQARREADLAALKAQFPTLDERTVRQAYQRTEELLERNQRAREARNKFDLVGAIGKGLILGGTGLLVGGPIAGVGAALSGASSGRPLGPPTQRVPVSPAPVGDAPALSFQGPGLLNTVPTVPSTIAPKHYAPVLTFKQPGLLNRP